MNEASSRSHAVFSVVLTAVERGAGGRPERRPFSKLHLVDLAGSERNKKSEAAGARFKVPSSDGCNSSFPAIGNRIHRRGGGSSLHAVQIPR